MEAILESTRKHQEDYEIAETCPLWVNVADLTKTVWDTDKENQIQGHKSVCEEKSENVCVAKNRNATRADESTKCDYCGIDLSATYSTFESTRSFGKCNGRHNVKAHLKEMTRLDASYRRRR